MSARFATEGHALSTVWLPESLDAEMAPPASDMTCDVAVIGGGLSGLSTALHLKRFEPKLDVALFEAGRIGYGASGLSSGQCAPRIGPSIERQVKTLGEDFARTAYLYSVDAMEYAGKLVRGLAIDCDCRPTGQWQVALRERDAGVLARRADVYRALGLEVPLVATEEVRRLMPGSGAIVNALRYPALQLNPGRLCIAMKRAAHDLGVRIFERARVTRFDIASGKLDVGTANVSATRSVVTVDGMAASLGILRRHVLPIVVHAAVTTPLTPAQRDAIGWRPDSPGLFDARPAFNFMRPMPEGSVLIGGEYRYGPGIASTGGADATVAARLARQLQAFFPSLSGLPIARSWYGTPGCTLNEWPIVTPLDDRSRHWHLGAWNGHGIALSLAAGHDLAAHMTGLRPERPLPWRLPRQPGIPAPLARLAIPLYLAYLRHASRLTHPKGTLKCS
ncbi:NAD(P)/FAD-dependent oxidoreductase [Paraburkholderia phymatum]|uniref:FAD dependent oxidoreductase n=1 Tax=Paraburkholderia phymatum (strain DSM 17167 / CIP 108236 / LMG 21445 / STM815) TaxID=391038 RepID=B2JWL7_PARP8|nr:FAD-dependent oxidoreductase [Paraburkholderia phymatum]ACC75344.1 FAD dependent oxidoreductase [Paraburkholderia phymatum STM815]